MPLAVLRSLEAQLRHAPRETLLRDVDRIEQLARDIEPGLQYPHDWIVFRVTGFRPDNAPAGTVPGTQLLASLSALAEVLCARAELRADELDPKAFVRASVLAAEWSASPATLKRWRRAGLISRRVRNASGREELWISHASVAHFRASHAPALARVRKADRLTRAQRDEVVARARDLQAQGCSLHAAAVTIAREYSRSTEGLRHALQTDPRTRALFAKKSRPSARDPGTRRGALLRLWRAGADPADLARLTRKGVPLTRRDINMARAKSLQEWLESGAFATPPPDDAPTPARTVHPGIDASLAPAAQGTPLLLTATLAHWRTRQPLPRATEHALTTAYHALRARAQAITLGLVTLHPSAHELDEAETALRHASYLRAALIHSQHRLIVETLEARAALPLDRLLPSVAARLIQDAVATASTALNNFDPSKGGRLAGPVGLAVDKAAVRTLREALPAKASTRAMVLQPDAPIRLPPLSPWDRSLLPDPRIVRAVQSARGRPTNEHLALLADRYGLGGNPPRTLRELRAARGMTDIAIARALQRALAHCLRNNPL